MPAIIAHHVFGSEIYSELQPIIGTGSCVRDAFLLGNLGPDPLLCLKALPSSVPFRDIGSAMHVDQPTELLCAVHNRCMTSEDAAVRAYALGFLCHYLLDSTVHPLVYAQQHALCAAEGNSGAELVGNTVAPGIIGGAIHAAIETEFDEHVLHCKLGIDVGEFSPHRETLGCPGDTLAVISTELASVVSDTYGRSISTRAFTLSVRLYRVAQRTIDSKREGLRRHIDYARLIRQRYPHILALTHSTRVQDEMPFTNLDHVPWPHPFEPGAIVSESFDELYEAALKRACKLLAKFADADLPTDVCKNLTGGLNFRGERVE